MASVSLGDATLPAGRTPTEVPIEIRTVLPGAFDHWGTITEVSARLRRNPDASVDVCYEGCPWAIGSIIDGSGQSKGAPYPLPKVDPLAGKYRFPVTITTGLDAGKRKEFDKEVSWVIKTAATFEVSTPPSNVVRIERKYQRNTFVAGLAFVTSALFVGTGTLGLVEGPQRSRFDSYSSGNARPRSRHHPLLRYVWARRA